MMQQLNKTRPNDYLLAMRILWIPIGLMILFYIWIPESPWYHARRGEKEAAIKSLKSLYGGVKGYDFEEEYSIIERTIIHEKAVLVHEPTYMDCFRGVDRVRVPEPRM
jgi:SP family general alpha glucoside:H+ symporter-like MFS transporter